MNQTKTSNGHISFLKEETPNQWWKERFFDVSPYSIRGIDCHRNYHCCSSCDDVLVGEADIILKKRRYDDLELLDFFSSISHLSLEVYCDVLSKNKFHINVLTQQKFAFLNKLEIREELRQTELGTLFLKDMEQFIKEQHFNRIYLISHSVINKPMTHDFFVKNGYLPVRNEDLSSNVCVFYKLI